MTAVVEDLVSYAIPDEPHRQLADFAAEQAVVGALLMAPVIADEIADIITSGDFYDHRHATIFTCITSLLARDRPVDAITVARELAVDGSLGRVGGAGYLHGVLAAVPTTAHAGYYARIVADYATRRRIRETAIRLDQYSTDLTRDIGDVIDGAQRAVHEATVPQAHNPVASYADLLDGTLGDVFDDDKPRGLSTGIGALDDVLGGLKGGQLVIVAGRPGLGKSVLVTGFARAAAMRRNIPTFMVSLEMSNHETMCRILSAESDIELTRILRGGLTDLERGRLRSKAETIRAAPFYVDDTRSSDLASVRTTARRTQQRHGLELLIIDYLQLMTATSGRRDTRPENRATEVGEISRGLKLLAGQLDVPIVAAAQLNRGPEQRTDKRPQLSDLRESGSVEQDADIVILLHRPDYYDSEHQRAGEVDLMIAKHRNGPLDTVTCAAQLSRSRIVDIDVPDR